MFLGCRKLLYDAGVAFVFYQFPLKSVKLQVPDIYIRDFHHFFIYFICLWWSYLMSELARFVQDWKLNNKDLTKILSHNLSSSYNIHTVSHISLHAAFIVIILPYTFVI